MLGLKLNHVSKRGPSWHRLPITSWYRLQNNLCKMVLNSCSSYKRSKFGVYKVVLYTLSFTVMLCTKLYSCNIFPPYVYVDYNFSVQNVPDLYVDGCEDTPVVTKHGQHFCCCVCFPWWMPHRHAMVAKMIKFSSWGWDKMAAICRRLFQMPFLQ